MRTCTPVAGLGLLAAHARGGRRRRADWPQRTVKFLVPLGPGSGVDIGARCWQIPG